jgi:hypothetical protein
MPKSHRKSMRKHRKTQKKRYNKRRQTRSRRGRGGAEGDPPAPPPLCEQYRREFVELQNKVSEANSNAAFSNIADKVKRKIERAKRVGNAGFKYEILFEKINEAGGCDGLLDELEVFNREVLSPALRKYNAYMEINENAIRNAIRNGEWNDPNVLDVAPAAPNIGMN